MLNAVSAGTSVIAIVVSIVGLVLQLKWEHERYERSQRIAVFKIMYEKDILEGLPKERLKVSYKDKRLDGIDDLCDYVNHIRRKSLYFKYFDEGFYRDFHKMLQEFEDYLMDKANGELSVFQYSRVDREIDEKMKCICDHVLKQFV